MTLRPSGARPRAAVVVVVAGFLLFTGAPAPAAVAQPVDLSPPRTIGAGEVPDGWPEAPTVTADAYVLADLDTGQVLAARDARDRRAVASTVKILTALSVLHRSDLTDRVTAGPEADGFAADSAGVGLDVGDTWSVEDLLEALVARSGNDAAATLAVTVGGTRDGFVELMRQDAARIGLVGPTLDTPDGLDDRNRLSADDLVALSRVAMADPRFADLAARAVVELPGLGAIASRNELLATYTGADGVKTGFTAASGRCLVASAERGGRHLLAVVLGSDGPTDHFGDAIVLLDHGFSTFDAVEVAGEGPDLRLKVPGSWIELDAPVTDVHVPSGTQAVPQVDLPRDATGTSEVPVRVSSEGRTIAEVVLVGPADPPARADGPGAWIAERAYEAMRAATAAHIWDGGDA